MISAIIVNFFLADSTIHAVYSLLPPNQEEEIEIWVVDNSESEEEAKKLKEVLGDVCHLIINDKNVGFGEACNQAYELAQGEWIFLLNPDAYLEPGALTALRQFLQNHQRVGAVGPRIYWDEAHQFLLPPSLSATPWQMFLNLPSGALGGKWTWFNSLKYRSRAIHYWHSTTPLRQKNLSGGHVLLRHEAIEKVGGLFDPQFFLYYEDSDLFLRLRQAKYQLFFLPEAVVVHAFGGCLPEKTAWKWAEMGKSHNKFMDKHYQHQYFYHFVKYIERKRVSLWQPQIEDLGVLETPPTFIVPHSCENDWLLEWSLVPYFFPAAGYFGRGTSAIFPESIWNRLPPAKHFVRIGSREKFWVPAQIWQWETRITEK
jgi:GT2 family glycosyltransferase